MFPKDLTRESLQTSPRKCHSVVDKRYYVGYKLHLIITTDGIFREMAVTPANVLAINFSNKGSTMKVRKREILGDRGYISTSLEADTFITYGIILSTTPRSYLMNVERLSSDRKRT
ncbi:MAG: transposase [Nonlabens sp.]